MNLTVIMLSDRNYILYSTDYMITFMIYSIPDKIIKKMMKSRTMVIRGWMRGHLGKRKTDYKGCEELL